MTTISAPGLALCAVTALCVSVATVYLLPARRAEAGPTPVQRDTDLASAVDKLSARLDALERRPVAEGSAAQRSEASVSREELTRMVTEAVAAARGTGGAVDPAAVPADAVPPVDLRQTMKDLLARPTGDAADALWATVRKQGKEKELLALFLAEAEAAPGSTSAQYAYGQACLHALIGSSDFMEQAQLSQTADKAFDKTLALDESHWEARYSKAVSYTFWPDFLGKKKEAVQNLQILIDQQEKAPAQPHYALAYLTLGNVLSQQGKDDEAKAIWERGLLRFPADAELLRQLGR